LFDCGLGSGRKFSPIYEGISFSSCWQG